MAYKAASSPECCLLLHNALDCLSTQLEEKLNVSSSVMNETLCNDQENVEPDVQQRDDLLSAAQLKKKDIQSKNSRQKRTWIDKLHKVRRKSTKSSVATKKTAKVCCSYNFNIYICTAICKLSSWHLYMLLFFRSISICCCYPKLIICASLAAAKEKRWYRASSRTGT